MASTRVARNKAAENLAKLENVYNANAETMGVNEMAAVIQAEALMLQVDMLATVIGELDAIGRSLERIAQRMP